MLHLFDSSVYHGLTLFFCSKVTCDYSLTIVLPLVCQVVVGASLIVVLTPTWHFSKAREGHRFFKTEFYFAFKSWQIKWSIASDLYRWKIKIRQLLESFDPEKWQIDLMTTEVFRKQLVYQQSSQAHVSCRDKIHSKDTSTYQVSKHLKSVAVTVEILVNSSAHMQDLTIALTTLLDCLPAIHGMNISPLRMSSLTSLSSLNTHPKWAHHSALLSPSLMALHLVIEHQTIHWTSECPKISQPSIIWVVDK